MPTPTFADPWRFEANVEVYLLVAFLVMAYVYAIRVIGPRAVPAGQPVVTGRQVGCFVGAMMLLFFASTWPIHQIGETYLYSVHMLQHMMLSYFMPPLVLLATPEWLARAMVGKGAGYRVLRGLCRPVVATVLFNVSVIVTHIPAVVNTGTADAPLHYLLHLMVVSTALLMWMPVVGPFPELQLGELAKLPYLFVQSVLPTIPAGWLTFAEGTVYHHYAEPVRVWGLSPTDDQQIAGAIMKTGGGLFLWTVVLVMFIRNVAPDWRSDAALRRRKADEPQLTYDDVAAEFARSAAPKEPPRTPRSPAS